MERDSRHGALVFILLLFFYTGKNNKSLCLSFFCHERFIFRRVIIRGVGYEVFGFGWVKPIGRTEDVSSVTYHRYVKLYTVEEEYILSTPVLSNNWCVNQVPWTVLDSEIIHK